MTVVIASAVLAIAIGCWYALDPKRNWRDFAMGALLALGVAAIWMFTALVYGYGIVVAWIGASGALLGAWLGVRA